MVLFGSSSGNWSNSSVLTDIIRSDFSKGGISMSCFAGSWERTGAYATRLIGDRAGLCCLFFSAGGALVLVRALGTTFSYTAGNGGSP